MVVEFCEEKVYGKEFVRGGGGGRSLKELAGKVRESFGDDTIEDGWSERTPGMASDEHAGQGDCQEPSLVCPECSVDAA